MARDIYNIQLMERVNYKNHEEIRRIFTLWATLEQLAERGDTVAHSILIDLKSCLGEYPHSPTTLTEDEIYLIRQLLIIGYSQKEIGERLGVTQKTISVRLSGAVHKIMEMLKEEKGAE